MHKFILLNNFSAWVHGNIRPILRNETRRKIKKKSKNNLNIKLHLNYTLGINILLQYICFSNDIIICILIVILLILTSVVIISYHVLSEKENKNSSLHAPSYYALRTCIFIRTNK